MRNCPASIRHRRVAEMCRSPRRSGHRCKQRPRIGGYESYSLVWRSRIRGSAANNRPCALPVQILTRSLLSWQRATRRTSLSVGTASVHQVPLALSTDDRRGTVCGRSSICGFGSDKHAFGHALAGEWLFITYIPSGSTVCESPFGPRPARLPRHASARACPPLADAIGRGRRCDTWKHRIRSSTEALLALHITRTVHSGTAMAHRSRQVRERMMYASTRESCKKELGAALWVGDYFASEKHEAPLRPT